MMIIIVIVVVVIGVVVVVTTAAYLYESFPPFGHHARNPLFLKKKKSM